MRGKEKSCPFLPSHLSPLSLKGEIHHRRLNGSLDFPVFQWEASGKKEGPGKTKKPMGMEFRAGIREKNRLGVWAESGLNRY